MIAMMAQDMPLFAGSVREALTSRLSLLVSGHATPGVEPGWVSSGNAVATWSREVRP